ncbi:MAG TPA: hypothetical protein VMZ53_06600 [Kofleriaceae bacterium]|nr:hypothetical protein [Kofleriaceae bacterium]
MKAAKWICLAGAVLAVVGFFLPFVTVRDEKGSDSITPYQMVFAGQDTQAQLTAGGTTPDQITADLREVAPIMVGFWVPAILLAIFATIAIVRGRMSNGLAILAMLAALANIGAWFVFHEAMLEMNKEEPTLRIALGIGTHALLAGGLLGFIAAAAAMFRPERAI